MSMHKKIQANTRAVVEFIRGRPGATASKKEIEDHFYPAAATASERMRDSITANVTKRISRARQQAKFLGVEILTVYQGGTFVYTCKDGAA